MKKLFRKEMILAMLLSLGCLVGCNHTTPTDSSAGSESAEQPSSDGYLDLTDLSVRDFVGQNGVVAAANPYAAKAGIDVLKAGGNAFDAAVAVSFALGVVEPHASGVGGGGVLVGFNAKKGEFVSYNFREFVPAAGTADQYTKETLEKGVKASGVPTQVAGLLGILEKEGSKLVTRQQVMAPAIDYAENGFTITPELGSTISDCYQSIAVCEEETYMVFDNGLTPLKAGDTLIQTNYANTLKKIANQGLDGFYKGEVANAIVALQEKHGGLITHEDLQYAANNYPVKANPVKGSYRGYDIVSTTTPSSGGTILVEALNMLEHYGDITKLGYNSAEYIHVVSTALQLAYGDKRKYIADANFVNVPLSGLLSKEYAADRWDEIFDPDSAFLGSYSASYGGGTGSKVNPKNYCTEGETVVENTVIDDSEEHFSTTAFSVCDKDGNIVSITQTINHFFGNTLIPAGTGFFMNGQLSSFTVDDPKKASYVEPHKQPVSHIMPTIILKEGIPWATLGSPGSLRIPMAVALTVINLIDWKMNIQEAIEAPRFFSYAVAESNVADTKGAITYDSSTGVNKKWIEIEGAISAEVCEALAEKNYYVQHYKEDVDLYFGGVHGITFNALTGEMHGGADRRRDGKALGY